MPASLKPNTVIREQNNKPALLAHIASLLLRIAKKYQIPNFDEESALLLAEDTLERYQFDLVDVLIKCLELPPHTGEKNWRLTPDTISEWMAIILEKEAEKRERELSKEKQKTVEFKISDDLTPETKKMIQDYLDKLSGPKMVQAMTDEDIKKFGKERPHKTGLPYNSTPKDEVIMKELRRKYYLENYDKITGKPLENWLSFDEWILL